MECVRKCEECGAEYADVVTKDRHVKFYHHLMEYSREIGQEWIAD